MKEESLQIRFELDAAISEVSNKMQETEKEKRKTRRNGFL